MKETVFLTGSSGFIGQHLIAALFAKGFEIIALTRKPLNRVASSVKYVKGDLADLREHSVLIGTCQYFINLAGEKSKPEMMRRTNVDAVGNILDIIADFKHIKFVQISSSGIYGIARHPDVIINERSIVLPGNEYEKSKHLAEELILQRAGESVLKYIILRPSNVFGENDPQHKLLNLMKSLLKGRFYYVRQNAMVNYIYVKDFARMTTELLLKADFNGEVFNMNAPISIKAFIEMMCKALGIEKRPKKLPSFFMLPLYLVSKAGDSLPKKYQYINSGKFRELTSKKYYSIDNLNKILPVHPQNDMEGGLKNLTAHYREIHLL